MAKSYFDFRQFRIYHDRCAMKVGTDGVLLGAWSEVHPGVRHILDIGTGSGLIAIMLAQKAAEADITGIDLDPDAVGQAMENAGRTPWQERLHFIQADAMMFTPSVSFDMVVCNPPFFVESLLCPDTKRTCARHSLSMPFEGLILNTYNWLCENGIFNVILPFDIADNFAYKSWEAGFSLYRKTKVFSRPGVPIRTLLSLKKGRAAYPETEHLIIRDADNNPTPEYRRLTEDYYIHY